ncbi:hypothetical protein ACOJTA_13740 [Malaciobacter sp. WC5094]
MFKYFISLIFVSTLYANNSNIDAYSEYKYNYYSDGIAIKTYTILKYEFNESKNQFGFRDILLFSLRDAAREAKEKGFKNIHVYFNNKLKKDNISIDEYLTNFNPNNINYIYNYKIGKQESSFGIGSIIGLGLNIALATVAVSTSNHDLLGNSLNGIASSKKGVNLITDLGSAIDNANEKTYKDKKLFCNVIELPFWMMYDENFDFKKRDTIVKFSIKEIEIYFKKKNPFRIKDLYTTNKHYITRGLIEE